MASKDHTINSGSSNPAYEIVKHIMIDIKDEPEDLNTTKWNIYKVPGYLRSLNESAYTPQLISIGPLHYGGEKLHPMQKQKLRYLNLFRCRVKNNMDEFKEYLKSKEAFIRQCYPEKLRDDIDKEKLVEVMLDEFKEYLKRKEADIRQCYAEKLCDDIDKEKLAEMMLLDSVFIMELFLRIQNVEKQTYSDDIIVKQSWLNKSIRRDLLLLENQIPLFILEELYKTFLPEKKHPTFIELARDFFDGYHTYGKCDEEKKSSTGSSSSGERPKHFTDMIRSLYICEYPKYFQKGSPLKTTKKLQEVGVIFEKVDNRPLLDIKCRTSNSSFLWLGRISRFKMVEARLKIPELRIDHTTECVFSNIMALEQCHYPDQPYVCSYVSLLNSLIHTKEDVGLLVEKKVIAHTLGSDTEVETLVHDLGRNVLTNETCYKRMIDELNRYYERMPRRTRWMMWWNRSMAALRLVYFRDLWRASAAIIGLVLHGFFPQRLPIYPRFLCR